MTAQPNRAKTTRDMAAAMRELEARKLRDAEKREQELLERRGLIDVLLLLPDKIKQLFKSHNR